MWWLNLLFSFIAFILGYFLERIKHSWSVRYQMAIDHFDDLKELVIKPLLNKMEGRRYGTEAQTIDNFLFEDLIDNHYHEVKESLQKLDKMEKEYFSLHDRLRKKLFEYAKEQADNLKMDWFNALGHVYESLYEHVIDHPQTAVEDDLTAETPREQHGEKITYLVRVGSWTVSRTENQKEANKRLELLLKLLNHVRSSDKLLKLKDKVDNAATKLSSQREKIKRDLRRILYSKRLRGECELIND